MPLFRNSKATRAPEWDDDPRNPRYLVRAGGQTVLMREHSGARFGWGADGRWFSVRFHVTEDGVKVREFSIEAGPDENLTAKAIKALPMGDVIRFAFEEAGLVMADDLTVRTGFVGVNQREVSAAMDGSKRPRGRPRSTGDDEYRRAAELYREAQANGDPTSQAVADGLGVSLSTARKRIMGARAPERGYLPPTGGTTRPKVAA